VAFSYQVKDGNDVIWERFDAARPSGPQGESHYEDSYFHFSKHGEIDWKSNPDQVTFLLHGAVVHQTPLPQPHAGDLEADP
jgi:hypothetical protein